MGRSQEALALFERLRGLCNDVGLISEEYDPATGRLVGNFPQAFTHVGWSTAQRRSPTPRTRPSFERFASGPSDECPIWSGPASRVRQASASG